MKILLFIRHLLKKPKPKHTQQRPEKYIRLIAVGVKAEHNYTTAWYYNTPENQALLRERAAFMFNTGRYWRIDMGYGEPWQAHAQPPANQQQHGERQTHKTLPQ